MVPNWVKNLYSTGGKFDLGKAAATAGGIAALYGALKPDSSVGEFLGMGSSQQPVGYMGGIPEYDVSRQVLPEAFATTTAEGTPRRPGSMGRRYFTDTTFTPTGEVMSATGTPATATDTTATTNATSGLLSALPEEAVIELLSSFFGGGIGDTSTQAATDADEDTTTTQAATDADEDTTTTQAATDADEDTTTTQRSRTREAIESDPARQAYAEAYTPRAITGEVSDLSGLEIYQTVPGNQTPLFSDPYNDIAEIINYMESTDGISTGEAGRVLNYAINNDIPLTDIVEITQGINPDFTIEDAVAYLETYYPHHSYNYLKSQGYAGGGLASLGGKGYYLGGSTDGMADQIPATIDGAQPAALSDGEFVIPADVVSHLGNGNSNAGAQELYAMMDKVREDRTGTTAQGFQINPRKYLPA
jgi:hypothetical protein